MSQNTGFIHSIKVPKLYKVAAKIVKSVVEDGTSYKDLIYQKKQHPDVSGVYGLVQKTLQNASELDHVFQDTQLLEREPRLDKWLARVLVTQLIMGKSLKSDCKPIQTILAYANKLQESFNTINHPENSVSRKNTVNKPKYVRVNTLLILVPQAIQYFERQGFVLKENLPTYETHLQCVADLQENHFIQDFHIPELLVFSHSISFYNCELYERGHIFLQDKSSCFPSHLLNPSPGSIVMDLCAAPGMKTTHLAAIMKNQGKIYAFEMNEARHRTLCEQVEKAKADCVEAIHKDALTVENYDYPEVKYILVDPSCSGSGMVQRLKTEADAITDPERLKNLQAFQVFILRHALLNFPYVERVVYSTCSIHPEENESVIDEILFNVGDAYNLIPTQKALNDQWINKSSENYNCKDNCLYAKFEKDLCNGFFVAVFERNFDVPLPPYKRRYKGISDHQEFEIEQSEQPKRKRRGKKKKAEEKRDDELEISNKIDIEEKIEDDVSLQVNSETVVEKKNHGKKKKAEEKRNDELEISNTIDIEEKKIGDEVSLQVNSETVAEKKNHRKRKKSEEKRDDELEISNKIDIEEKIGDEVSLQVNSETVVEKKNHRKRKKSEEKRKDKLEISNTIDIEEKIGDEVVETKNHRKKKKSKKTSEPDIIIIDSDN